jgi:hypothetical protein
MITLDDFMQVCALFRDEMGELCAPKASIFQKMHANFDCSDEEIDRVCVKAIRRGLIEYYLNYKEPYLCDPME